MLEKGEGGVVGRDRKGNQRIKTCSTVNEVRPIQRFSVGFRGRGLRLGIGVRLRVIGTRNTDGIPMTVSGSSSHRYAKFSDVRNKTHMSQRVR